MTEYDDDRLPGGVAELLTAARQEGAPRAVRRRISGTLSAAGVGIATQSAVASATTTTAAPAALSAKAASAAGVPLATIKATTATSSFSALAVKKLVVAAALGGSVGTAAVAVDVLTEDRSANNVRTVILSQPTEPEGALSPQEVSSAPPPDRTAPESQRRVPPDEGLERAATAPGSAPGGAVKQPLAATANQGLVPESKVARARRETDLRQSPSLQSRASLASGGQSSVGTPSLSQGVGAEVQALRKAQLALRDGEPGRALAGLRAHRFRALVPEALVTEILALCAEGRSSDAARVTERFVRRFGDSPLVPRLRSSCAAPVLRHVHGGAAKSPR